MNSASPSISAARASAVFDIDHHLDARQVSWKRAPIDATICGSARSLDRIGRVIRCLTTRRNLLDLFQPEQHLVFWQRLSTTSEAMALQFFDDLTQPFVLHPLCNQHRFQRAEIIG